MNEIINNIKREKTLLTGDICLEPCENLYNIDSRIFISRWCMDVCN